MNHLMPDPWSVDLERFTVNIHIYIYMTRKKYKTAGWMTFTLFGLISKVELGVDLDL